MVSALHRIQTYLHTVLLGLHNDNTKRLRSSKLSTLDKREYLVIIKDNFVHSA